MFMYPNTFSWIMEADLKTLPFYIEHGNIQ